jgi:hypothetical protein
MTQADGVHSTPRKTAFKIVAGTDFAPVISAPAATASASDKPVQRKKERGAYNYLDRKRIEYQDGLPVIDPAGEEDPIFHHIAAHRRAIDHYDRCITVQCEAEGKVSDSEYTFLEHSTGNAFGEMICHAKGIILCKPTTRRGLIHQARYLAAQFIEHVGWDEGACQSMYLPGKIGDRP